MNLLNTITIVIDLILISAVIVIWRRLHRKSLVGKEDDRRIRELTQLRDSIDKLLMETVKISSRLSGDVEKKRQIILELMVEMEKEKIFLENSLEEYRNLTFQLKKKEPKRSNPRLGDRYSDAIRLAKMGLSPNEIANKVNIPVGEIELVLSLRK